MERLLLLLPGPMQVPEEVADAARRPLFFHRSERFLNFQNRLRERIRPLFGSSSAEILFLSGPGTAAMESAVVNMTSPGEEIIVIVGGVFAQRWVKIARAFGLDVHVKEVDWREGARPSDVREAMDQWPDARVVYLTWSESSTGVLIELDEIGPLVRDRGGWLVADAVSGLAVSPLRMDDWNVDVVVVGSQKGLMLPPGLAIVAANARAFEKASRAASPRFALDWEPFRKVVPSTPALSLMHQLDASLDLIEAMGPGGVYRRRAEVADRIRNLVTDCGLELYARRPGNGITAVLVGDTIDAAAFRKRLEDEHGILIAGGQGPLEGQILRIGHVGHLTDVDVEYFSESFRKVFNAERKPIGSHRS